MNAPAARPSASADPDLGPDPRRVAAVFAHESARFAQSRPETRAALDAGAQAWLSGVPMHWMRDWPMPFPLVIERAAAAVIRDVDGNEIDDFCLGDTGSMFGHSPPAVARAIRAQAGRGLTYMLPSRAALRAGALLDRQFGLFRWQAAATATDANRYAIKVARAVTGRNRILVFDGSYHGTVDDLMVTVEDGRTVARPGLIGVVHDPAAGAVAVGFNDLAAVEEALAAGDIAAVLTEPVMTNSCMVLPAPGFLEGIRDLTRRYGALLIIDETHTQSSGPGGYARMHGIEADMIVVGKCIAGGMPMAVWGLREDVAARFAAWDATRPAGHSGMGTTLSANPMQFACLVATLEEVATPAAYARMERGAARLERGLAAAIARHGLLWHVVRVGARVEFICAAGPLTTSADAAAAHRPDIERTVHLCLLNRGCLIAPFHNMMLVSPVTRRAQIDRLIAAFDETLAELTAPE
ncbi:MAG: aspartate aminotransferase family protein [Rubellimicrobium sp.]|nr:aspartate aminotransferase family protein [Rubellimicrobium sp.]